MALPFCGQSEKTRFGGNSGGSGSRRGDKKQQETDKACHI